MGQGCTSNYSNYFSELIPDTGVKYTGPAIPSLGICTNDLLSEVEAVLLQKILDYSTGVGISIPSIDLTTCDLFKNDLTCCSTCTDLPCLLNAYLTALCTLYGDFTTLQTEISALLTGPYNTACLTLGSNPTLTQIIQELILEYCKLYTQVQTIQSQLSTLSTGLNTSIGNFLATALGSCQGNDVLNLTGSGATTAFSLRGFAPIGAIMPLGKNANLSNYDSTGLGRTGTDACGWALCNGNNGTDNLCGLVPVGTTDMGTSPISGAVLPLTFGSVAGEYTHSLTGAECSLPSHTHTINEGIGHGHNFKYNDTGAQAGSRDQRVMSPLANIGANLPWYNAGNSTHEPASAPDLMATVDVAYTGITINPAGGTTGGKHNNMQPYKALYYIQRVS